MNVANQTGLAFRNDMNLALVALAQNSSGSTAPATTFAYQFWIDTSGTNPMLKIRNAANSAWVILGRVDIGLESQAFTTVATAAGTTTLTVASNPILQLTGVTTQIVALPAANTLPNTGLQFFIFNRSTGAVTVKDNSGTTLQVMLAGAQAIFTCTSIGSSAGTWDIWYTITGTLPVTLGGTGVTSVTSAPGASAFAGWDANSNLSGNNLIEGYATTATAAGTTTLTVASAFQQYFTGSTTQTVKLPVASTLVLGQQFAMVNQSSGVVTVQSSGANSIQAMAANSQLVATCILTSGTGTASWQWTYGPIASTGLPAVNPMTTGGDIIYGGSSGTPTRLANGSSGQVVQSAGSTSAPTWATLPGNATALKAPTTQVFTSGAAATYTTPTGPGPLYLEVIIIGGGAGGGGANSGGLAGGGGGGGGGVCVAFIASPSATYTYTVGASAAGGTAGNPGTAGNLSKFNGTTYQATGGTQGTASSSATVPGLGGAGGVGSGGFANGSGSGGTAGTPGVSGVSNGPGGAGGGTAYGGGGAGNSSGAAGLVYGGGGGGGSSTTAGGAGAAGVIIVKEHYQ